MIFANVGDIAGAWPQQGKNWTDAEHGPQPGSKG
jgi:hypothetical protein